MIIAVLYRSSSSSPILKHFFPGLLLRVLSGIAVGVLYFEYYGEGDTLVYHETASFLARAGGKSLSDFHRYFFDEPGIELLQAYPIMNEPRSSFFIKIISLIYIFNSENYWITSAFFSLLSFTGSWYLANTIIRYERKAELAAVISLLYFPSFVLWTSGMLKESLAWFCLAQIAACIYAYYKDGKCTPMQIVLTMVLFIILWKIKYHYAAVLSLCSIPLLLQRALLEKFSPRTTIIFYILGSLIIMGILMLSHPNFRPARIMTIIHENHEVMIQLSDPGHAMQFIPLSNSNLQFFVNIPVSLFGGLFMPLPWQGVNFLAVSVGIINAILLLLFLWKGILMVKGRKMRISLPGISLTLYIVILAILMAYTTPNFGTLERYKIAFIPFFALWVLYNNPLVDRMLGNHKQ